MAEGPIEQDQYVLITVYVVVIVLDLFVRVEGNMRDFRERAFIFQFKFAFVFRGGRRSPSPPRSIRPAYRQPWSRGPATAAEHAGLARPLSCPAARRPVRCAAVAVTAARFRRDAPSLYLVPARQLSRPIADPCAILRAPTPARPREGAFVFPRLHPDVSTLGSFPLGHSPRSLPSPLLLVSSQLPPLPLRTKWARWTRPHLGRP